MLTDTIIEDDRWLDADLARLAEDAARATLEHLRIDPAGHEIAVLGCDDNRIAALNTAFRSKPAPTNVLSWPATDLAAPVAGDRPAPPPATPPGHGSELGDIAIAFETCRAEAARGGKPLSAHVSHLIVHATLHLLGYDHIRDPDATLMEQTEAAILGGMGLANPYEQE